MRQAARLIGRGQLITDTSSAPLYNRIAIAAVTDRRVCGKAAGAAVVTQPIGDIMNADLRTTKSRFVEELSALWRRGELLEQDAGGGQAGGRPTRAARGFDALARSELELMAHDRTRELQCLYSLSRLVDEPEGTLEECLARVPALLRPPGAGPIIRAFPRLAPVVPVRQGRVNRKAVDARAVLRGMLAAMEHTISQGGASVRVEESARVEHGRCGVAQSGIQQCAGPCVEIPRSRPSVADNRFVRLYG